MNGVITKQDINRIPPAFSRVEAVGVSASVATSKDYVRLSIATKEQFDQFAELLQRGSNCWDTKPQWVTDLCDAVTGTPAPYSQRDRAAAKLPLNEEQYVEVKA